MTELKSIQLRIGARPVEFARMLGVDYGGSGYKKWMSGTNPTPAYVIRLARLLAWLHDNKKLDKALEQI